MPLRRLLLAAWLLFTAVALFTPAAEVGQLQHGLRSVPFLGAFLRTAVCRAVVSDSAAWHGTLFFGLALLVIYQWDPARRQHVLLGLLALTGFSLLSESIQAGFVAGRAFEWSDLLVNQVAVLLGAGIAVTGRRRPGSRRRSGVPCGARPVGAGSRWPDKSTCRTRIEGSLL